MDLRREILNELILYVLGNGAILVSQNHVGLDAVMRLSSFFLLRDLK